MVKKLLTIAAFIAVANLFYELYKIEQQMDEVDRLMLKLKCTKPEKNIKKDLAE